MTKHQDLFKIGDRIEITREGLKESKIYPSQILDSPKTNIFIISGPIYKNNIIPLHKGETIDIAYLVENRGMYVFKAKIIEKKYDPIYKLKVEKISQTKKYQKREYYRFEASIPVVKKHTIDTGQGEKVIVEKCKTKNISGGGLNLLSNFKHGKGDMVTCSFNINHRTIEAEAKILRIEPVDTYDYKYSLGIHFLDIKERDRDEIIKFIFEQERILREKGLI